MVCCVHGFVSCGLRVLPHWIPKIAASHALPPARRLPLAPLRSVEHAVTIRNDVNLKKASLRLVERDPAAAAAAFDAASTASSKATADGGILAAEGDGAVPVVGPRQRRGASNAVSGGAPPLYLEFTFDAASPCAITVYFMAMERPLARGE